MVERELIRRLRVYASNDIGNRTEILVTRKHENMVVHDKSLPISHRFPELWMWAVNRILIAADRSSLVVHDIICMHHPDPSMPVLQSNPDIHHSPSNPDSRSKIPATAAPPNRPLLKFLLALLASFSVLRLFSLSRWLCCRGGMEDPGGLCCCCGK